MKKPSHNSVLKFIKIESIVCGIVSVGCAIAELVLSRNTKKASQVENTDQILEDSNQTYIV